MVQLNTRYDAVMSCLLSEKRKDINIKDIFNDDLLLNDDTEQPAESSNHDDTVQEIFEQGIALRDQHDYLSAFMLFEQAAQLGYAKAMGAMGRAYFLAEGCEENQVFGLAWLIEAAKHGLAPAIDRVNVFKESDAELYHDALAINQALTKNNA